MKRLFLFLLLLAAIAFALLPLAASAQSSGDYLFQKKSASGPLAAVWVTPGAPPSLFGTITGGNASSFTLGSGLALSGSTLSATGGAWGSITGTLASQTDLQTALDAKASTAALASYLTTSTAATTYQPLDADLTSIAALTTATYGRSLLTLADAAALRTTAGLVIGTNVQAYSATLADLAARSVAVEGSGVNAIAVYDANSALTAQAFESGPFSGETGQAIRISAGEVTFRTSEAAETAVVDATSVATNRIVRLPAATDGTDITLLSTGSTLALSQLAQTSATSGQVIAWNGTSWAPATPASSGATLASNTFTGLQQFTGTAHAGLRLNNLTTAQRDALTGSAGMVIWNTTDGRMQLHNGTAWTSGMVRLSGDTMTGALNITAGTATASTPPLNITQIWNNAAVTFRGIEFAATNTASNAASTLIRLLGGASGTTQAFAITASTGAMSVGASNNSATITLQGSDRSAVAAIGAFGSEFRLTNLQLGTTNAALRFTDANAVARYGTIYGETTDVLALRNGSGGTTGASWELLEMTAPGTPSADRARLYLEDNGSGKSRLVLKWADGTTTVLATQP